MPFSFYPFIYATCLLLFGMLQPTSLPAEEQYGYITYSTGNLGDYIQAIAAKKFIPKNSIGIDREFIGVFNHPQKVKTLVNGWFMCTKDLFWNKNVPAPIKSWPPARIIEPLLISVHFIEPFFPCLFTDKSIAYLKKYGPVGARDRATLKVLQAHGIPSYFSGCLTLTLNNPYGEADRQEIIYAVDLDEECVRYLKSQATCKVKVMGHTDLKLTQLTEKERLAKAEKRLELYRKAKCVITTRLHASMPCLAIKTPVLLVGDLDSRFDGLSELLHTASRNDFLEGKALFDFNHPPKKPRGNLSLRENLIKRVTRWVASSP